MKFIKLPGWDERWTNELSRFATGMLTGSFLFLIFYYCGDSHRRPIRIPKIEKEVPNKPGVDSPNNIPKFPWPPPQSSAIVTIPYDFFSDCKDLSCLDSHITKSLQTAGYDEYSYFSVPYGFGMVTHIEQITEARYPVNGKDRWCKQINPFSELFSLSNYISAFLFPNKGYYRVFVFIISPVQFFQDNLIIPRDEATSWLKKGFNSLPLEISNLEYSSSYNVTALVYEFIHEEGDLPQLIQQSIISGKDHLIKAKIWKELSQTLDSDTVNPLNIASSFCPCGWFGDGEAGLRYLTFDPYFTIKPHSSPDCIKISYKEGPKGFAGIRWLNTVQEVPCNWGQAKGYDLLGRGFTKITFWAKGQEGNEYVEFEFGGVRFIQDLDRCEYSVIYSAALGLDWKKYTINFSDSHLKFSNVINGFSFVVKSDVTFFLDDIQFE